MEHEHKPEAGAGPDGTESQTEMTARGCGTLIAKIIAFGIVAFIVVVGLVFGVCLFGSG